MLVGPFYIWVDVIALFCVNRKIAYFIVYDVFELNKPPHATSDEQEDEWNEGIILHLQFHVQSHLASNWPKFLWKMKKTWC